MSYQVKIHNYAGMDLPILISYGKRGADLGNVIFNNIVKAGSKQLINRSISPINSHITDNTDKLKIDDKLTLYTFEESRSFNFLYHITDGRLVSAGSVFEIYICRSEKIETNIIGDVSTGAAFPINGFYPAAHMINGDYNFSQYHNQDERIFLRDNGRRVCPMSIADIKKSTSTPTPHILVLINLDKIGYHVSSEICCESDSVSTTESNYLWIFLIIILIVIILLSIIGGVIYLIYYFYKNK